MPVRSIRARPQITAISTERNTLSQLVWGATCHHQAPQESRYEAKAVTLAELRYIVCRSRSSVWRRGRTGSSAARNPRKCRGFSHNYRSVADKRRVLTSGQDFRTEPTDQAGRDAIRPTTERPSNERRNNVFQDLILINEQNR